MAGLMRYISNPKRLVKRCWSAGRPSHYFALALITLLARVSAWPVVLIDPDEYAFILAGREVLHGHLPYVTMFDIKPVGPSVLLASAMAIGGARLITIRVFGAICVFTTAICLYEITRILSQRRREAFASGALYIAFSVLFGGLGTMTEIMLAPFSAAGALLLLRWYQATGRGPQISLAAGAGLAYGIAVCIKIVPLVPAIAMGASVAVAALAARRAGFCRVAAQGMLFGLGVAVPMAAAATVFFVDGKLQQWLFSNYGFMHLYAPKLPLHVAVTKAVTVLIAMWPLTFAGLLGVEHVARRGITVPSLQVIIAVWLCAELVAVILPGQMFPHYFLQLLPPLSILAASGLERSAQLLSPATTRLFPAMLTGIVLVPVLPSTWDNLLKATRVDPLRTAAAWLKQHRSERGNALLVLSYDLMPEYFLTGAPLPTRIPIPLHLFGPQRMLGKTMGGDPLAEVLALNPGIILIDRPSVYLDVSSDEHTAIESKLASCYGDVADFDQSSMIGAQSYQVMDIAIFDRKTGVPNGCTPSMDPR